MLLQQHDEIVTLGSLWVHGGDASVPRVAGVLIRCVKPISGVEQCVTRF
jgi:hypothetical protein